MKIGGGWRMFQALYRMSRINMYPAVKSGEFVPIGTVVKSLSLSGTSRIEEGNEGDSRSLVDISSLVSRKGRPLVLNFGSCT